MQIDKLFLYHSFDYLYDRYAVTWLFRLVSVLEIRFSLPGMRWKLEKRKTLKTLKNIKVYWSFLKLIFLGTNSSVKYVNIMHEGEFWKFNGVIKKWTNSKEFKKEITKCFHAAKCSTCRMLEMRHFCQCIFRVFLTSKPFKSSEAAYLHFF